MRRATRLLSSGGDKHILHFPLPLVWREDGVRPCEEEEEEEEEEEGGREEKEEES